MRSCGTRWRRMYARVSSVPTLLFSLSLSLSPSPSLPPSLAIVTCRYKNRVRARCRIDRETAICFSKAKRMINRRGFLLAILCYQSVYLKEGEEKRERGREAKRKRGI